MDTGDRSHIRIRTATAADVDVILHHRRRMFEDMGEGCAADHDTMIAAARPFLVTTLRDGAYRGWLVQIGDRIVAGGGVALVGYQPTPADARAQRAWILNVYTEPAFRRQGLARLLMDTIVAWCRDQGFASVSLHASAEGRALYEALGFRATNEMRLALK